MKIRIFRSSDSATLEAAVNDFISNIIVRAIEYHPEHVITKYQDGSPRESTFFDSVLIMYEDK